MLRVDTNRRHTHDGLKIAYKYSTGLSFEVLVTLRFPFWVYHAVLRHASLVEVIRPKYSQHLGRTRLGGPEPLSPRYGVLRMHLLKSGYLNGRAGSILIVQ